MPHEMHVKLACCGTEIPVFFDEADYPVGAPNVFKKDITCPECDSFIIMTLSMEGKRTTLEQEIIGT